MIAHLSLQSCTRTPFQNAIFVQRQLKQCLIQEVSFVNWEIIFGGPDRTNKFNFIKTCTHLSNLTCFCGYFCIASQLTENSTFWYTWPVPVTLTCGSPSSCVTLVARVCDVGADFVMRVRNRPHSLVQFFRFRTVFRGWKERYILNNRYKRKISECL